MSRKKKPPAEVRFTVRITTAERARWEAAAKAARMTLSQWLRRCAKWEVESREAELRSKEDQRQERERRLAVALEPHEPHLCRCFDVARGDYCGRCKLVKQP